ncbi:MAG: hypothetical protein KKD44_27190 [Proteobacteria bacterium]|nr:hypothetical protein [Pseudomonadota bacterium]
MNPDQFWRKATDYYDIYHGKYRRAVLTDEELRETVADFIEDMMALMGEWYNSQENNDKEKE